MGLGQSGLEKENLTHGIFIWGGGNMPPQSADQTGGHPPNEKNWRRKTRELKSVPLVDLSLPVKNTIYSCKTPTLFLSSKIILSGNFLFVFKKFLH